MGLFTGKKGKVTQHSTQSAFQQELSKLINQGLATGEGAFADIFGPFDEQAFEEGIRQPALKEFEEDILPQILNKYSGKGGKGGALRRGLRKGAEGLESELAKQKYAAIEQQKQNRIKGVQTGLGANAVENIYQPAQEGIVQGAVKGFAQGVGSGIGGGVAGGVSNLTQSVLQKVGAGWR